MLDFSPAKAHFNLITMTPETERDPNYHQLKDNQWKHIME